MDRHVPGLVDPRLRFMAQAQSRRCRLHLPVRTGPARLCDHRRGRRGAFGPRKRGVVVEAMGARMLGRRMSQGDRMSKAAPPQDMEPAEWRQRVELAACYRLLAHYRMT